MCFKYAVILLMKLESFTIYTYNFACFKQKVVWWKRKRVRSQWIKKIRSTCLMVKQSSGSKYQQFLHNLSLIVYNKLLCEPGYCPGPQSYAVSQRNLLLPHTNSPSTLPHPPGGGESSCGQHSLPRSTLAGAWLAVTASSYGLFIC